MFQWHYCWSLYDCPALWQQYRCWSSTHYIHIWKDRIRQRWGSICFREQRFPDSALTNSILYHIDQIFVTWASQHTKETRKHCCLSNLYSIGGQKKTKLGIIVGQDKLLFLQIFPLSYNCLLSLATWMFPRHLKVNIPNTWLMIFSLILSSHSAISRNHTGISSGTKAGNRDYYPWQCSLLSPPTHTHLINCHVLSM